jgi:glycosyltransferase involved in cell wall biosynthesis
MRSLIVDLAQKYGGAEVRVLQLAQAFKTNDCQVACLSQSPLAEKLCDGGLKPLEMKVNKSTPQAAWSLREIIENGGFDIIDAHNIQSFFWVYLATLGMTNRPALVATVHSSSQMEHPNPLKAGLYEAITRLAVPKFDQVVTVSKFIYSELTHYKISEDHISRIPNGVQFIKAGREEGLQIRKELGIDPADLVVGTIGRLEPAKGIDILIPAIARLLPDWPQIKCLVVGDGRLSESLKDLAKEVGIEQRVIFTGFRSDIPRLLEAYDIFTLPSRTEGIPFALLEACFAALPVVASRVGGVPEIISDGQTGCLVDPEDIDGLAKGIDCLLRDRSLAKHMGQQAAQDVKQRFTIESMIDGTQRAYAAAIEHRKASSR